MKINTFFSKFSFFSLLLLAVTGIFVFQAQDTPKEYQNEARTDEKPPEFYTRRIDPPVVTPFAVITKSDGFDNFNLGTDAGEVSTASNPQNPLQVIAAWNSFGAVGTDVRHTADGINWVLQGPTWGATMHGDPVVVYDSLGNGFHDNMTGPGSTITGTRVARTTDGGVTWTSIVPGNTGNDKNWMAADQTSGPYANYVYGTMTNGSACNFMRSTDHGATFTITTTLTPHGLPGAMVCVGPNGNISGGNVYVVTNSGSSFASNYTFFRSTDGGVSFTNMGSQFFANYVGTVQASRNTVEFMRTRPYPIITADNSYGTYRGRLYLVYASNNPSGDLNKPDIYSRYSTDFGTTWSAALTVNDDPNSIANHQWHPFAWSDKETGKLYVQWMDTRNCPTSDSSEIYATYSTDGGQTFAANQRISNAKAKINCLSCGGGGYPATYLGDYNGIATNPVTSTIAWTDFRFGLYTSMVAYFPDYAYKINQSRQTMYNINDSTFTFCSIPDVKLYSNKVKFTAAIISTPPANGTITLSFVNKTSYVSQDSLTAYPDSLRLRIKTSGGVTAGTYVIGVTASGPNGTPAHIRYDTVSIAPIGIQPISSQVPAQFWLYQNYPNPFNPVTNIRFDLPRSGNVKMTIYDIMGREVAVPVNGYYGAGKYNVDFDASNIASGIYFYKIETGNYNSIKKMILIK